MKDVIAIALQKGGVGKTTGAVNIAAAAAGDGLRVLLIDCDVQGNLTETLGFVRSEMTESIADLMLELAEYEADDRAAVLEDRRPYILETAIPCLSLVPSKRNLNRIETNLLHDQDRFLYLRTILESQGDYDLIVLDTPPNLGVMTMNALVAARRVIIPMELEDYSEAGLEDLFATIRATQKRQNPVLEVAGVYSSMVETSRRRRVIENSERIAGDLGEKAFRTQIKRREDHHTAKLYGLPAITKFPNGAAAQEFRELWREIKEAIHA